MGYFVAGFIMLIGLFGLFTLFTRRGGAGGETGTLPSRHPVSRQLPSADAPNPSASIIANAAQKENARKKTPPA